VSGLISEHSAIQRKRPECLKTDQFELAWAPPQAHLRRLTGKLLFRPGTPVDDHDYQVPFSFTGKIDKLTFAIEPPVLTEEDRKKLEAAYRAAQDAN